MTHEISRGARKLSRTPTLIQYIYIYISLILEYIELIEICVS